MRRRRTVLTAPYGYRLARGALIPEPREQAVIALVRGRSVSLARLAEELTAQGHRTRTGGPWNTTAVWLIAKATEAAA